MTMPLAAEDAPRMALRDAYSQALVELGRTHPNVVVLDADLALSTKTKRFGTLYPDRFFDIGIAELNLMGVAAGLAAAGKTVFASTFAAFAAGQPYNVIRQSIAYSELDVKIVATHAGISVGGDGATHQMLEDISLMRSLPNMRVFVPADGPQTQDIINAVADSPGPCFVRLPRGDTPLLPGEHVTELGKAITLREGQDVTLVGAGTMVYETLRAADMLVAEGVDPRVILIHTIKPFDNATILKAARETKGIVTAEEHSIIGGLGSCVAEVTAENHPTHLRRVGVKDTFGESGPEPELMVKYGLTADDIARAAREILKL